MGRIASESPELRDKRGGDGRLSPALELVWCARNSHVIMCALPVSDQSSWRTGHGGCVFQERRAHTLEL